MNKARITYRFDHDREKAERHMPEQRAETSPDQAPVQDRRDDGLQDKPYDSQMLNQFTTDFGAWSSPFDIEVERLEKLIRESGPDYDTPSSTEAEDDRGRSENTRLRVRESRRKIGDGAHKDNPSAGGSRSDRIRKERYVEQYDEYSLWTEELESRRKTSPHEEPIIEEAADGDGFLFVDKIAPDVYPSASYYRSSWPGVILSMVGAITLGLLFGLFVMQMFTDLTISPDAPPVSATENETADVPPSVSEDEPSETGLGKEVAVNIPEQTFYMLQYGVFSTAEGANEAQRQLRNAGIASGYEFSDGRHIVYGGITPDRNSALLLSNQLEKLELETYVKPYERAAVRSLPWGEAKAAQIESYIADGAALARMISLLTLIRLEETQPTNFEEATMEALLQSHQQWTMTGNQLSRHIPQSGEQIFERMNNEMTTAVNSLFEYRKNPSESYLWQAQTAVMNYVMLEKRLLEQ
jgi:stage II sporulation protein B